MDIPAKQDIFLTSSSWSCQGLLWNEKRKKREEERESEWESLREKKKKRESAKIINNIDEEAANFNCAVDQLCPENVGVLD